MTDFEDTEASNANEELARITASVAEFHDVFGEAPTPKLRAALILEETAEVREAAAHLLKEICDLCYVLEGAKQEGFDSDVLSDEQKAYVEEALTYMDAFTGQQFVKAFAIVHKSNMSKLGLDGKPIYRADGKVLKGPNYEPANLSGLI